MQLLDRVFSSLDDCHRLVKVQMMLIILWRMLVTDVKVCTEKKAFCGGAENVREAAAGLWKSIHGKCRSCYHQEILGVSNVCLVLPSACCEP